MHEHPLFLAIMVVALLGVGAYVFMTPSLRNGLPIFATQHPPQVAAPYTGDYKTGLPTGGKKVHLSVTNDNHATMTVDSLNDKPAVVETGDATMESKGNLLITLTKKDGVDLPTVAHLSFTMKDDELILADPVAEGFASGLILKKIN